MAKRCGTEETWQSSQRPTKSKWRWRKTKKKYALGLLLTAMLLSVVCATVYFSKTIPSSGRIKADYQIEVRWQSNATEVLEIQWGSVLTGEEKTIEDITLRNVGNVACYMEWHTENLPTYLTLSAMRDYDGWMDWTPNTWIGPFQPPPNNIYVLVRFTLTVFGTATPGTSFNFNIIISAADSSSG